MSEATVAISNDSDKSMEIVSQDRGISADIEARISKEAVSALKKQTIDEWALNKQKRMKKSLQNDRCNNLSGSFGISFFGIYIIGVGLFLTILLPIVLKLKDLNGFFLSRFLRVMGSFYIIVGLLMTIGAPIGGFFINRCLKKEKKDLEEELENRKNYYLEQEKEWPASMRWSVLSKFGEEGSRQLGINWNEDPEIEFNHIL